jgi:hypothetical protein
MNSPYQFGPVERHKPAFQADQSFVHIRNLRRGETRLLWIEGPMNFAADRSDPARFARLRNLSRVDETFEIGMGLDLTS